MEIVGIFLWLSGLGYQIENVARSKKNQFRCSRCSLTSIVPRACTLLRAAGVLIIRNHSRFSQPREKPKLSEKGKTIVKNTNCENQEILMKESGHIFEHYRNISFFLEPALPLKNLYF